MSADDILEERRQHLAALNAIAAFVDAGAASFPYMWNWGDGEGGWILKEVQDEARRRGLIR